MNKRKKISLWVVGGLGAVLLLLLVTLLLAPKLINLDPKVQLDRFDVSVFPIPHVVARRAKLSIPGKVSGTVESLGVYPKLLPLLKGKLEITEIQIENPSFRVILPGRSRERGEKPAGASSKDLEKTLTTLLAPLALDAPHLVVEVENGRLDLAEGDRAHLWF
jgi:uncharacterized protein involved in outer membrane biogenesis